ncbi:MAG: EAL domain-containing protein [Candidatus Izemoplasma sp.]|nr:EAL domain-containing protein [Candidatus Izemoplasma sp.]
MKLTEEFRRLSNNEKTHLIKRYLVIILPLVLVYIIISWYIDQMNVTQDIKSMNLEHQYEVQIVNYAVKHFYEETIDVFQIIENSDEMASYKIAPIATTKEDVKGLFSRMAINTPKIEDIRLLDNTGQELIHISQETNEVITWDVLKDQSNEPYFLEAQLLNNEVYISPLTLESDNGSVITPYNQVLHVATPLYSNDTFLGVLVVTTDTDIIYDSLNNTIIKDEYVETGLITEEGYYLYHTTDSKTFGWLLSDRDGEKVVNDYTEGSTFILSNNEDYLTLSDSVIYKHRIHPFEHIVDVPEEYHYEWQLYSVIDDAYFDSERDYLVFHLTVDDLIIIGLLIGLSLIVSAIYYLRKRDLSQLAIMKNIANKTNDIVIISNNNQIITYVNKAFEQKTGYTKEDVIGKPTKVLQSGLHTAEFYEDMWQDINAKGTWTGELWEQTKSGVYFPKRMTITALPSQSREEGETYVSISSDLTDVREHQRYLVKSVHSNNAAINKTLLTDLCYTAIKNNKGVFGIVNIEVLSVSNIYLKEEKTEAQINQKILSLLTESINGKGFLAQVDKRTFILGITAFDAKDKVIKYTENLLNNEISILKVLSHNVYVNAIAGVAVYPSKHLDIYSMIEASYLAKDYALEHSEQKYYVFTKDIQVYYEREAKLVLLLREAISNKELTIQFQPQYDAYTKTIIGAEALIRWYNDELGQVSPLELITVAEKTGYIIELGHWIIEETFRQIKMINAGISDSITFSLNISPYQFKDAQLIPLVKEYARKYTIDLSQIEIEITESVFAKNFQLVNNKLKQFKELGICIAVDDFGTGYSSLQYLQELSIDRLKIDRLFIKDYPEKHSGRVTQGIVNLAKQLALDPICEGVETKTQQDYLLSIDCHLFQGYYYYKAMPAKDLLTVLDNVNS